MTEEEVKNECGAIVLKFENEKSKIREYYHRIANNKIRILEKKKNEKIAKIKQKCLTKKRIEFNATKEVMDVMTKVGVALTLENYKEIILKKNNKEVLSKVTRAEIIRKGLLSYSLMFIKNQILLTQKKTRQHNAVSIKTEIYEDDFLAVERALGLLSPKQIKANFFQSSCIVGIRYYVQKIKDQKIKQDLIKRIDAL